MIIINKNQKTITTIVKTWSENKSQIIKDLKNTVDLQL